jgi:hypothetical protein
MIALTFIFAFLPASEYYVYETNDHGKIGQIKVETQKDSLGYHLVYTSDRVIEATLDTLNLKTLYLKKVIQGKLNVVSFNDRYFRVFYKSREHKYINREPIYDRHTLDFVVRGFVYERDFKKRIRVSVPEFMIVNADLDKVGEDTVHTPAGDFECWKIRLIPRVIFTKMQFFFWIEKDYPNRFVKYSDTSGKNQILLKEYR